MMIRTPWATPILTSLLALTLLGCSAPNPPANGSSPTPSATSAAGVDLLPTVEGKTQYPLTVKSPWGESVLPARPKRVAAVGWSHDEEFLSMLGITPVVTLEGAQDGPWMKDAYTQPVETTVSRGDSGSFPYEAIAAAKPDLIVVTGENLTDSYAKLSAIAPVVAAPEDGGDLNVSWQDRLREVAKAVDLVDAGEQAIADIDAKLAAIRDQYPQFKGKTLNYVAYYGAEYGLRIQNGATSTAEEFFTALGFSPSPLATSAAAIEDRQALSNEQLGQLDADVLVIADNTYDLEKKTTEITDITDLPLYQNLPVVKDGRALALTNGEEITIIKGKEIEGNVAWALSLTGPLGKVWAAEVLSPFLAETVGQ